MIEGVLRHDTDTEIDRAYVDSHGQSEVAFAFCKLLGFRLLPRLKAVAAQRLYLPEAGTAGDHPSLDCILTRAIDWELIEQQYDEVVRHATALPSAPPTLRRSCAASPATTSSIRPAGRSPSWGRQ